MTSTDDVNATFSARLKMIINLGEIGRDRVHTLTHEPEVTSLVSDALARIENQTYGLCLDCEERITPKRLAALPWARYCMTCQEARDGFVPEIRWNSAA